MTGTRLDVKQNKKKVMEKRKEVGVSTDKKKNKIPPHRYSMCHLIFVIL